MNIWIDLSNSPHVNFFKYMIKELQKEHEVLLYSGPDSAEKEEVIVATVDLSASDRMRKRYPLFRINHFSRSPDWRLKLYQKMLQTIDEKTDLGKYE